MTYSLFNLLSILVLTLYSPISDDPILKDKTLISWVSLDNLTQQGGSALTLDGGGGIFDGIVFGEKEQGKWMSGSNNFLRTQKDQSLVKTETASQKEVVQIAITYAKSNVTIYRNGNVYSKYKIESSQEFDPKRSCVLFGLRHLDAGDPQNSLVGIIKEARIYNYALSSIEINNLKSGASKSDRGLWAWWDFKQGAQELTSRFKQIQLTGEAQISDGYLILPGSNSSLIASGEESGWQSEFPVPQVVIQNTRALREKLLSDPYRPAYHFCLPEDQGIPGDPNGAFYYRGRYHLMYLYKRSASGFSWGHVSSTDLLHWRHHPDAIGPGNGDEGCFSGGAYVDNSGIAYLTYWMLWGAKGIGIAKSIDPGFNSWHKFSENPVIHSTEWGITSLKSTGQDSIFVGSADPSNIWKKDGIYYMLTGNLLVLNKLGRQPQAPAHEKGDRLYLWKSNDLKNWTYVNRFYESNREWTQASEDNMCPSFLPLPMSASGGQSSSKHLLLFISHNLGCQYYIGDYHDDHFYPSNHGRMTWTDNSYFAPEALIDDKGRQIMWAWIFDERPADIRSASGWTGTYGLPRSLWLGKDGNLRISPVEELKNLRYNKKLKRNLKIDSHNEVDLTDLSTELMEVELITSPLEGKTVGVKVCVSKNQEEETLIYYDASNKTLNIDTRNSGLGFGSKTIESAPFTLNPAEKLQLRIYVDRSIVEVFANDRQAIARRIYPTLNGKGLILYGDGEDIHFERITTWEMSPSNPF